MSDPNAESPATSSKGLPPAARAIGLAALALLLYLPGNARTGLWDRDEPRYAQCAREMIRSGDYLRPTHNGEPRHHKPVFIYWLMAAAMRMVGDSPFGARLPSALAGAASCVLVWHMGRKMMGEREAGIAAVVLLTAPLMFADSKLATTDATLALLFLACQYALWELGRRPSRGLAAMFWVALGLSLLTKGPVCLGFLGVSAVLGRWWGGPSPRWGRLHGRWGLPLLLAVAAPWYVFIGIDSHGDFYRFAIGTQIVQRIKTGMETHGGFPGYYPVTLLASFFPWSALLPAAMAWGWSRRKAEPAMGDLLGWCVGPMILLECVRTKLVHYYLPSLPACALLVGGLVAAVSRSEVTLRRWPMGRLAMGLLAGMGIGLAVGLMGGAIALPAGSRLACLAMAVATGAGVLVAMERFHSGRADRAVIGLAGSWAIVLVVFGGWFLPSLEPHRLPGIVARELAELSRKEGVRPILATYKEPSIIYAMGRTVPILNDRPSLERRIRRDGAAVSAFNDLEMRVLGSDRNFTIEDRGTIQGLDLTKGPHERLHLVVLRVADGAIAAREVGDRVTR